MALNTKQVNQLIAFSERLVLKSITTVGQLSTANSAAEVEAAKAGVKDYYQKWKDVNNNITNVDANLPELKQ